MSYLIAAPEMMTAAATDLATIGSDVNAAHMVAAAPTIALVPAAADEVSAGVAQLFSRYAEDYHALAGRASAFHGQFVQHFTAGAGSYANAEAALASLLRPLTASAGSFASIEAAIKAAYLSLVQSLDSSPHLGIEFIGFLLASPPLDLIAVLLTAPVSIPLLFWIFAFSML